MAHACSDPSNRLFRLRLASSPSASHTVARVQQNAHRLAKGLGGDVVAELAAHNTVATVCPGDAAPDDTNPGAALLGGGLVDVGNALNG